MSTSVSYKGNVITTFSNATKTLTTSGKWLEDNITIVDTESSSGGSSGSGTLTSHTITFTLRDNTTASIPVEYNDALISTMITSYVPEKYNNKNVLSGALDNVEWFNLSSIPFDTELIDFTIAKTATMVDKNTGLQYQDSNTSSSCCTDFIPIDPGMTFSLMAYHWYNSVFYNENKQRIGYIYIHDNGTAPQGGGQFWTITLNSSNIPANTAYIRINTYLEPTAEHMSLIRTA